MSESVNTTTLSHLSDFGALFCDGDWIESKDQDPDGDVRLIQLADIGDGYFINKSNRYMTMKKAKELRCTFLKKGDVLIARMPDPLGRACIFPLDKENAYVTVVDIAIFRPNNTEIDSDFLMNIVNSPQIRQQVYMLQSGTTRKRISRGNLGDIDIPLPLLDKQRNVVNKINTLFSDIDSGIKELEYVQQKLGLYRQSILNAAIRGKLVSQDSKDEPASKLLEKIQKEKEELIAAKKIKKEKPLLQITEDEIPFELPEGWEWVRLGQICNKITDGFHNTPKKVDNGITYISAVHVKDSNIDWDNAYLVGEKDHKELFFKAEPKIGEILIVNIGAGCGDSAIIDRDIEFSFKNVAILKFDQNLISSRYLHSYLLASKKKHFSEVTVGGCQPFFSLKVLNNFLVPLPPLAEQKRIIKKIDDSLVFYNSFEQTLRTSISNTEKLKRSILKKAFEGEL